MFRLLYLYLKDKKDDILAATVLVTSLVTTPVDVSEAAKSVTVATQKERLYIEIWGCTVFQCFKCSQYQL